MKALSALILTVVLCAWWSRSGGLPAYPVRPPFSATEIAGRWIGFTMENVYGLDLRAGKTGTLTLAYQNRTNQETLTFEIARWNIGTNNVFTCSFRTHDVRDPAIMSCDVKGDRLEALLRNGPGGWKQSIGFWREKVLDETLRMLRK